jgi:hypothetical protein
MFFLPLFMTGDPVGKNGLLLCQEVSYLPGACYEYVVFLGSCGKPP